MQCFLFINSKYFKHKCYYQRNKKKLITKFSFIHFILSSFENRKQ